MERVERRIVVLGVVDCEDLSNWFGRQGFPRSTPGISAQEFILGEATTLDARCALVEAVFVLVTVGQRSRTKATFGATSTNPRPTMSSV